MPSKSFRYIVGPGDVIAMGSGWAEFVIETTDGQAPTSTLLSGGFRVFSNTAPAGTHNIDFNKSYVVIIRGFPRNDTEKINLPMKSFTYTEGELQEANTLNPGILTFSSNCTLEFTLFNNDWINLTNVMRYNSATYGSNPTVGVPLLPGEKIFRSPDALQSYINTNALDYTLKFKSLDSNRIATTSDKTAYYGGSVGLDTLNSTVAYSQFSTPSSITFDEMAFAVGANANASGLSGSMTMQLHAVSISTLRSNPNRTPEAQVTVPLYDQLVNLKSTNMGKFVFGKLSSAVTLPANVTHTLKVTFSNVGTHYTNGLRIVQTSSGVLQYNQSSAYGTNNILSNSAFPFMLTTEIPTIPSNTAATDITLSPAVIAENSPALAVVGALSVTDAENSPHSYELVAGSGDTDNALFEISGSNLRLKSGTSLNYEAKSAYSVRVKATDTADASYNYTRAIAISVSNVNEAPFDVQLSALSIQEGNAVGDVIGTLSASDPEGQSCSFSIVPGAGDHSSFTIVGSQLKAAEVFDFETKQTYSVTVRASDGSQTQDQVFAINVLNMAADDDLELGAAGIVLPSGRVVAKNSSTNPKLGAVKKSSQPLQTGSIVRFNGQKFVKSEGAVKEYLEIKVTPPGAWGWDQDGVDAWEDLQLI